MKKYFITLSLLLFIIGSFYIFESFNYAKDTLKDKKYSFSIQELNEKGEWVSYKKDNPKVLKKDKKKIKSIITLKKTGEATFDFSFLKELPTHHVNYILYHNHKQIDSFELIQFQKHQSVIKVNDLDTVEIVAISEAGEHYWGELEISVDSFPLDLTINMTLNEMLIMFLWIVLFMFLAYHSYIYLALFYHILLLITLTAERLNFGFIDTKIFFAYTFYYFLLTFIFIGVYQLLERFKRFRISSIFLIFFSLFFLLVPLLFMLYSLNFDHELTKESLYAIFQSNGGESYEYIEKFIQFKYILLFLFILLGMFFLLYKQGRIKVKKVATSSLLFMLFFFLIMTISYESKFRLNNFIYKHIEKYQKELRLFKEVQAKRKLGSIDFKATKEERGETYVVVIGESLNKNHMGIYGYKRATTPQLSGMKDELILYQNAYSNHTHTVPVLSLALTEANQYNKKDYFDSPSIIEVLNKAGVETYWLTNQTLYGAWDNKVSVMATEAQNIIALNHSIGCTIETNQYDEVLIEKLKPILRENNDKNRVIFVHLMGSHSLYSLRYPKEKYSIFSKTIRINEKGVKIKNSTELNNYDNTVYYNDYVVSSILKLIQEKEGVNAFLYFSDHSEDIERDVGHSWERFSYEMTEIPFLAWFSPLYKKRYLFSYTNFEKHQNKLFSNDMVYDTLIGLFGIKTEHYKKIYDLTSSEYVLTEEEALVLHGKKKYVSPENHCYWERKNEKLLEK